MSSIDTSSIINKKGVFGFGLSHNDNLDLLNLIVLACAGIMIKIFFQENYTKLGNVGPASTTIWGYGLTAVSLMVLLFMSLYLIKNRTVLEKKTGMFTYIKYLISDTLPILATLFIILYVISLNFMYFTRINSNRVTESYHTYSFMSSLLLIIQLGIVFKYLYDNLHNKKEEKNETVMAKNVSYILASINFVFIVIVHIILSFFSTDG